MMPEDIMLNEHAEQSAHWTEPDDDGGDVLDYEEAMRQVELQSAALAAMSQTSESKENAGGTTDDLEAILLNSTPSDLQRVVGESFQRVDCFRNPACPIRTMTIFDNLFSLLAWMKLEVMQRLITTSLDGAAIILDLDDTLFFQAETPALYADYLPFFKAHGMRLIAVTARPQSSADATALQLRNSNLLWLFDEVVHWNISSEEQTAMGEDVMRAASAFKREQRRRLEEKGTILFNVGNMAWDLLEQPREGGDEGLATWAFLASDQIDPKKAYVLPNLEPGTCFSVKVPKDFDAAFYRNARMIQNLPIVTPRMIALCQD